MTSCCCRSPKATPDTPSCCSTAQPRFTLTNASAGFGGLPDEVIKDFIFIHHAFIILRLLYLHTYS